MDWCEPWTGTAKPSLSSVQASQGGGSTTVLCESNFDIGSCPGPARPMMGLKLQMRAVKDEL